MEPFLVQYSTFTEYVQFYVVLTEFYNNCKVNADKLCEYSPKIVEEH